MSATDPILTFEALGFQRQVSDWSCRSAPPITGSTSAEAVGGPFGEKRPVLITDRPLVLSDKKRTNKFLKRHT